MTDIYLVVVEDRHVDVDVLPFSTDAAALAAAEQLLNEYGGEVDDGGERGLSADMEADGWIYYKRYSIEGDSIRIIARGLDS